MGGGLAIAKISAMTQSPKEHFINTYILKGIVKWELFFFYFFLTFTFEIIIENGFEPLRSWGGGPGGGTLTLVVRPLKKIICVFP